MLFFPTFAAVLAGCPWWFASPSTSSLSPLRPTILTAAFCLWLAVSLSGCGASHVYRLNTPPGGATAAFKPIARCARAQGFMVSDLGESVHVKVAPDAWVYFNTDVNNRLQMVLHFMGAAAKTTPADPLGRATRRKADAIWACARGQQHLVAPVAAPPAPPVSPAPPVHAAVAPAPTPVLTPVQPAAPHPAPQRAAQQRTWPSTCAQLVVCYADMSRLLCHGATDCKSKVSVKGSPDEAGCRDLLRAVGDLMMPLRMLQPNLQKPASCQMR